MNIVLKLKKKTKCEKQHKQYHIVGTVKQYHTVETFKQLPHCRNS